LWHWSCRLRAAPAIGAKAYFAITTAGGFQVPSPAGKIDGASVFGQYRRITR
jgi:hypothetical protein